MELLLEEHGETLFYGIIGAIVVTVICLICSVNWKTITPNYKYVASKSNKQFIESNQGKYPTIEVDETIYTDYEKKEFDYHDFITAKDCNGNDITEKLNVYGNVDVFQKGIYELRCVVVDKNQLTCTKYINVIVE